MISRFFIEFEFEIELNLNINVQLDQAQDLSDRPRGQWKDGSGQLSGSENQRP